MSAGHTATKLPPSKPQKVSKSKMTKSEVVGVTLDATALLLATLRDAARLAPIPMVQSAATLALAILNTVQVSTCISMVFRWALIVSGI
jgi:hypothetical protein